MALWPHDDDLQIFFFKISYNSWCYLTQVLTWHCNAISELWIGNDFKYFRYLSGWLITHSKHNFQCQCHQFATWTVLPTLSIWVPNISSTGICQLLDKSNNFLNFIKSIKFFNFYGKTKIAFYSISLFSFLLSLNSSKTGQVLGGNEGRGWQCNFSLNFWANIKSTK